MSPTADDADVIVVGARHDLTTVIVELLSDRRRLGFNTGGIPRLRVVGDALAHGSSEISSSSSRSSVTSSTTASSLTTRASADRW